MLSDYKSIQMRIRIADKAVGPSSIGPTPEDPDLWSQLGNWAATANPAMARGERREERGPCQVLEAVSCVLLG